MSARLMHFVPSGYISMLHKACTLATAGAHAGHTSKDHDNDSGSSVRFAGVYARSSTHVPYCTVPYCHLLCETWELFVRVHTDFCTMVAVLRCQMARSGALQDVQGDLTRSGRTKAEKDGMSRGQSRIGDT